MTDNIRKRQCGVKNPINCWYHDIT